MNATNDSKDTRTLQLAEEAAERLDELAQGGEEARRSFVSWVTTSPRHLEESFRMVELNATLTRLWERQRQRKRGPTTSHTLAPKTDCVRTIKKYTNRRLYDTVASHYITLSDIGQMVLERVDFVVVDHAKREDITRSMLLQVIAEQEQRPEPLLTREFLLQVIRAYGIAPQAAIGSFLEQTLRLFAGQSQPVAAAAKEGGKAGSPEPAIALAQTNFTRWRQVQDAIDRTLVEGLSHDP